MVILELIHVNEIPLRNGKNAFIRSKPIGGGRFAVSPSLLLVTLNNIMLIAWSSITGESSFKRLPYQMSMVGSAPTMVLTGNVESGFNSGERA